MPGNEPIPQQMLAVILGASSFRRAPKLAQGRAFYNSAQDFQEYLTGEAGLAIPRENIVWLFDDSRSPSDQLQDIRDFLESRTSDLKNKGTSAQDLILYYVGHGLFSGSEQVYCLAVRATDERSEAFTSIRAADLAAIVKDHARFLRKFLILDCCFSATAYKEFQSSPLQAGRVKLLDELPQKGTTLLCSSSAHAPSLAPRDLPRTMFSDALLKALHQGHPFLGTRLSMSELGDLVKENLREAYPSTWVRPEVHSPDQREGDVANIGLFPNAALEPTNRIEAEFKPELAQGRKQLRSTETERSAAHRTAGTTGAQKELEIGIDEETSTPRPVLASKPQSKIEKLSARNAPSDPQPSKPGAQSSPLAVGPLQAPKLLKLGTGNEILRLHGHRDLISGVAWSSDGERLATGSKDKTAKIWDAETGMELLVLRGHTDAINSLAWSPNGERLATAGWDDTVIIWNADGDQMLQLNGEDLYLVDWSPDGKRLATTCGIWSAENGEQQVMLEDDGGWALSLAWSHDGNRLATGTRDETAIVWDAESGKKLVALSGHVAEIESIAWSPDGIQLATGSQDGTVKIWDVTNGKELLSLNPFDKASITWCVAWSPHGKWLATGGSYGVKIWKPGTNKELLTLREGKSIHSLSWSPDGKRLATGNSTGTIVIWDIGREPGEVST